MGRSILLWCDDNPNFATSILDSIEALVGQSRHDVYVFNNLFTPRGMRVDLDEFDAVVIHHSLCAFLTEHESLAPWHRKIREFAGLKIQLVQDEYRGADEAARVMRFLGIDVLLTLVPPPEYPNVWGDRLPGVELVTYLAGYVPDRLVGRPATPPERRPIDVGYRGRESPFWLGAFAQEKNWIADRFLEHAPRYGLKCDISWRETDRLYGRAWERFNDRCRAVLGCGSGASIADPDGACERAVRRYLAEHPGAPFAEVAAHVLPPWEGSLALDVISPRQFEAIAARTALVLFPGPYSGILRPWEHYIPLERDFANIAEVAGRLRDLRFLKELTERAYEDVIASGRHSYRAFVGRFDDLVDARAKPDHRARPAKEGYRRSRRSLLEHLRISGAQAVDYPLRFNQPLRLGFRTRARRHVVTVPCLPLQKAAAHALRGVRWLYRQARRRAAS